MEHSFPIQMGGVSYNWKIYDVGGAVSFYHQSDHLESRSMPSAPFRGGLTSWKLVLRINVAVFFVFCFLLHTSCFWLFFYLRFPLPVLIRITTVHSVARYAPFYIYTMEHPAPEIAGTKFATEQRQAWIPYFDDGESSLPLQYATLHFPSPKIPMADVKI